MRILVTGAAGFVGRHLCAHLRASGHDVTPLTSVRSGGDVAVDLREQALVGSVFARTNPDAVVHLAARYSPKGLEDMEALVSENVAVARNVLAAAYASVPRARVILMSSSAVYGPVPRERNPIGEGEPLRPVLPYGASKAAVEAIASVYRAQGLDVVVARAFNLAGPGQGPATVPASFASRIANAKRTGAHTITVGNLTTSRDFTDVRDAVRALERLLVAAPDYGPYNVCAGMPRVIGDILADLQRIAGTALTVVSQLASPERNAIDVAYQCGNRRKIYEAVGWEPCIEWDETVRSVMNDWERRVREGVP